MTKVFHFYDLIKTSILRVQRRVDLSKAFRISKETESLFHSPSIIFRSRQRAAKISCRQPETIGGASCCFPASES